MKTDVETMKKIIDAIERQRLSIQGETDTFEVGFYHGMREIVRYYLTDGETLSRRSDGATTLSQDGVDIIRAAID